jgi:hypothetical protein
MMGLGFAGLGFMGYRRKDKMVSGLSKVSPLSPTGWRFPWAARDHGLDVKHGEDHFTQP